MTRPRSQVLWIISTRTACALPAFRVVQTFPKQPHYASFIYLAATRDEAIQRLANLADGAAYPAVRSNVVAETPCAIAPDEVIAEFSVVTKPMLERIEQNNQQATTLANLRDALLPRLLSGQLRVKQ